LIPEDAFTVKALTAQIETILTNDAGALKMAQAALACGIPDATTRLVALVDELADK